jgi:hypothetical protein
MAESAGGNGRACGTGRGKRRAGGPLKKEPAQMFFNREFAERYFRLKAERKTMLKAERKKCVTF